MIYKKSKIFIVSVCTLFFVLLFYSKSSAVNIMLKVAFQPSQPLYQFLENGKPTGLHIDILNNIAEKNDFIIEYIPMDTNTECMKALEEGKVDMVLGVILKNNYDNKIQLVESISQSSVCMIASNEKAEMIKNNASSGYFTASFENGTIDYPLIQSMRNVWYVLAPNQLRVFNMLTTGEVDTVIGVRNSLLYQLKKANLEEKYTIVNNYLAPIEYSMAIRAEDVDFARKLNTSIRQLRLSGDYERIHNKWIDKDEYATKEMIQRIIKFVVIAVIAVLAIIIFNLRMNVLLKKQVNEKTKELQKINSDLQKQIIETRNNSEVKNCIVEDNPNGIIVFSLDYIITLFNPSASKLTGIYTCPIDRNVFEIDLLSNILSDKKEQLFLEGSEFIYKEITVEDKWGETFTYRYDIYQLFDFNDKIRGAILSIKDITIERKNIQQVMEREKNRALNQMIAGIAHEIRNPLMAIKTFVELIPIKKDSPVFQDQMAKYVPKELDRISALVRSLIDYAKPESSNKEKVIVHDVINSCAVLIGTCIAQNDTELKIEIEDGLIIKADQNQLKQVLINIMLNGFESMNEKIRCSEEIKQKLCMSVKAWGDEHNVFMQIIDGGIGMNEDEIKKSTEPFFTTKAKGTGLGLSISKQYVEENGGSMTIESEKYVFTKITLKFAR